MTDVIQTLVMISIIFLMLSVGLRTSLGQLVAAGKPVHLLLRGLGANFLVVPVLLYLLVQWPAIAPEVGIGIILMAAAPVAPMAPAPFVALARADLPYAVSLMTIAAVLCVPLTPVILLLCLPASEGGIQLDAFQIVQTILIAQLIPIGVGMAIQYRRPSWRDKLLKFVPKIGQVGLLTSVVLIVIVGFKQFIGLGAVALLAIFAAVVVCLVVGEVAMIGQPVAKRRSLAIATAIRNPALALLIATANFAGTDAAPALLVFTCLSMAVGFAYGKLRPAPGVEEAARSPRLP